MRSDEMAVGAIRGFLLCRTHVESVSGFFCTFSFGNMLQKTCHFFYLLISSAGDIMHLLEITRKSWKEEFMAQEDISEKTFIALNDVFADIFNALVFEGKQMMQRMK